MNKTFQEMFTELDIERIKLSKNETLIIRFDTDKWGVDEVKKFKKYFDDKLGIETLFIPKNMDIEKKEV